MHDSFEDEALVLRVLPCAGGAVTRYYTPLHGKIAGFTPRPPKNRPAPMPGALVDIDVTPNPKGGALPRVAAANKRAYGAVICAGADVNAMKTLNAALEITDATQHDGIASPPLFMHLHVLIEALARDGARASCYYPVFEAVLLECSGYGLSLQDCAAGTGETPCFVSPVTGAAAGLTPSTPYRHKLFPLPPVFRKAALAAGTGDAAGAFSEAVLLSRAEILQACAITGHFLKRDAGADLPPERLFPAREACIAALSREKAYPGE